MGVILPAGAGAGRTCCPRHDVSKDQVWTSPCQLEICPKLSSRLLAYLLLAWAPITLSFLLFIGLAATSNKTEAQCSLSPKLCGHPPFTPEPLLSLVFNISFLFPQKNLWPFCPVYFKGKTQYFKLATELNTHQWLPLHLGLNSPWQLKLT